MKLQHYQRHSVAAVQSSQGYRTFTFNCCTVQYRGKLENCGERNHTRGSSKHAWICLACKMRSGREKRVIGEIELTSSRSWIVFDIVLMSNLYAGVHVNYHIMWLTRMWHFGMIIKVLPECTRQRKAFWVSSPVVGLHSAGRVRLSTDLARCAFALEIFSGLRGPFSQAFTRFVRGVIAWRLRQA